MLTRSTLRANHITVKGLMDFFEELQIPVTKPTLYKKLNGKADWTDREARALRAVKIWQEPKPIKITHRAKRLLFQPDGRVTQFGKLKV